MKVEENKIILTKRYKIVTLKNYRHIYYLFFLCYKEITGVLLLLTGGVKGRG